MRNGFRSSKLQWLVGVVVTIHLKGIEVLKKKSGALVKRYRFFFFWGGGGVVKCLGIISLISSIQESSRQLQERR